MNTVAYTDKEQRDRAFDSLRRNGNDLECQAVKFSEVEVVMNPEVPGEILLDAAGRQQFRTVWCVAYPERKATVTGRRKKA